MLTLGCKCCGGVSFFLILRGWCLLISGTSEAQSCDCAAVALHGLPLFYLRLQFRYSFKVCAYTHTSTHTHTFIAAFDGIAVFWHSELVLFPVLPAAYVCNLVYVCLQREFPSVTCFHSSASVGGFVSGTVWHCCFLSLSLNFLINSSLFFSYSLISSFQNNLFFLSVLPLV